MTTQTPVTSIPRTGRLELTWVTVDATAGRYDCYYELVLPLDQYDCRGTHDRKAQKRPKSHRTVWLDSDNCLRTPLGRCETTRNRPPVDEEGVMDRPFRDGAHIQWDSAALQNLPCYVLFDGRISHLTVVKEPV